MKYAHTNLIARDWKSLAAFYETVFDCRPVPPERDQSGDWLDRATGIAGSHIRGMHLRLPGYGDDGPTLEIYQYDTMPAHPDVRPNMPGFSHIAFAVENVDEVVDRVLNNGGAPVGERVERQVPGAGLLTFRYVRDPEGNIIEIQNWARAE